MIRLAILIALIAVLDAVVGVAERWQSSKIGEGLILDLRRAVFGHVQRMPVAFFTRTRTGALVSRLNNDVIGAQRAFTWTLSGVVSNVIALVLTLGRDARGCRGRSPLLALVLLPVFVMPARRMGSPAGPPRARGGRPQLGHDDADDRALLGAGRDAGEAVRPAGPRGGRVRRPGPSGWPRSACARRWASTCSSPRWRWCRRWPSPSSTASAATWRCRASSRPGTVVTLALLLTRLYAPLTALASGRVDAMSALVSFERVFEVLDLAPLITEKPDAGAVPDGPVSVEFDDVRFAYPSADKVSLASLEEVATLDTRGGAEVLHGVSFRVEPGSAGGPRRLVGQRQVDHRLADAAALRRRRRRGAAVRRRRPRPVVRRHPGHARAGDPGRSPVPRHRPGEPALRPARGDRRRAVGGACARPGWHRWSRACPTGSTRWSASAATGSPAASASGSPSPASCWPGRASSSSTRPPPTSTRRRRPTCRRRWPTRWPAARRS